MPGKAGRAGNFGGGRNLKPCVHGISPRRCTDECRKKYWRDMSWRYREKQVAYIKGWRLRNREKTLKQGRSDYPRAKRLRAFRRIPVSHLLPADIPQIYLLPNEVTPT